MHVSYCICRYLYIFYSTCLGNRFARYLDDKGFTVFAGCLNKHSPGATSLKTECSSRIHVVEINVTRQESVSDAFDNVMKHLPSKGLIFFLNNEIGNA